ncbi:MAG: 50S ribosomal protein L6 [Solobacterium sp.]|nr:50S ribosomal protein L6 [Solobacterium sp.]MBQ6488744.1 50S ribosomal protein L6 [Solobacterium sp.]MCR5448026.1 50S ribosomal protein L6 [Solobacterium sp.]MDO4192936.1 50S ribosomal protein L6 [Erysipelotrichaceae bacterium]MDO5120713.1 50S ribosomal protein L6 [Erysipelotrichaceae bacterium]
MSRIGNKAITIPSGVEVTVAEGNEVTVKGSKGTLTRKFSPLMNISIDGTTLTVSRPNEEKVTKQLHGTTRALLATMIEGCDKEYTKTLQIVGIGYRAALAGNKLTLNLGYSHPVEFTVPEDLKVTVPDATTITITGIDKQRVGQFAAVVRSAKKPEPYGGKGVRYKDEHVRRKEGKTAAKK